jgi:phosphoesterase RecJ-like protein
MLREGPDDLKICDPSAAATCVLLAEWVLALGEPIDADLSAALFIGIATDTGWFRYSNADARTYRLAAALVAAGVNPAPLNRSLYERDPIGRLRLQGRLLETMEMRCGGKLAVLRLRQSDFMACQADASMTEDLVNAPGTLDGLEATVMFTEQEDGIVRVNFRSKERIDVGALAARFGGGGHARASGARISASWENATTQVISALESALTED